MDTLPHIEAGLVYIVIIVPELGKVLLIEA